MLPTSFLPVILSLDDERTPTMTPKKKIILSSLLFLWSMPLLSFSTLESLQKYAASHPEQPESDNQNWLDPDYQSYYQSLRPTFFSKIAHFFHMLPEEIWSTDTFIETLERVTKIRTEKNMSGRFVAQLQLTHEANFVIWGDLHASFHSLVRGCEWLAQKGIINTNLEIMKPDYYFVFNGDAISRSAYSLETLTIIMNLMEKNPEKVVYIRGNHEDRSHWKNYGLKRELFIRIGHENVAKEIPYEKEIDAFFNTLPLALYISTTKTPHEYIRISHKGRESSSLNETYFGDFWDKPIANTLVYYDTKNKKQSSTNITIKAIIKTEDWRKEVRTVLGEPADMFGLGLLDQDHGSTAWSILSSPTKGSQVYFNFYYDAFGVLHVKENISQSTIALYNQDINRKDGFKEHTPFNIISGISVIHGKDIKDDLKIGTSLALVGGVPILGQQVKRGLSARIQKANQSEEIGSHFIQTMIYNDDYTPYLARMNITKLLENNIKIILSPTGSPTLASYLDLVKEKNGIVLFPITGGPQFRKPDLTQVIHYRVTYEDEVIALVDHVTTEYSVKKFAFFYQDDAYGSEPLEVAHQELKKRGITSWTDIPYLRASTDFSKQAETIKQTNPDAIGFFSAALPTKEFIRQVGVDKLANKVLFGISFLGEESIRRFLKRQGLNIIFGAVVPNPKISTLEIAQEYRQEMDKNQYSYDVFSLESYIGTSIFVDALKKIKGDITIDAIRKQIESLKDYNLKGITLTFNPQHRDLTNFVWIETGELDEWIKKDITKLRS